MPGRRFNNLDLDPAKNPAVLDTLTWDASGAWQAICSEGDSYWSAVSDAVRRGEPVPSVESCAVHAPSIALHRGALVVLVDLADGQSVFIEIRSTIQPARLGNPIEARPLPETQVLVAYPADLVTTRRFTQELRPDKGPTTMGPIARLGIGSRMTTAAWPGVWRAMDNARFAANPIQNSMRELNLLDDLLTARPSKANYQFGLGAMQEGHTGSTFKGLWLAGVLDALKTAGQLHYGADADHIMIKRDPDGLARAKRFLDAARDYTFFTLDFSDVLDYVDARADTEEGLIRKYGPALDALEELVRHITGLKGSRPFDLELSVDECPPDVDPFANLTSAVQLQFLIREVRRRGIALTHVAPNVGIVKGFDYRGQGGLDALADRIRSLHEIARDAGLMLDFHSGDDLSEVTRRTIGAATRGENHFKLSPSLQVLFARTLYDVEPKAFDFWWEDTLDYTRAEASVGSSFARQCLADYEKAEDRAPSPYHALFHHFCFATVGKRDAQGRFVYRPRFYGLSPSFYDEYRRRVTRFLCDVANDVFDPFG